MRFYDASDVLGNNVFFNMIVGQRGNGKSYRFKKYALDSYLKGKGRTMWLRLTMAEIEDNNYAVINTFLKDLPKKYQSKFKVNQKLYCITDNYDNPVVLFRSVSVPQKAKSVPYPDVTTVILDEALSLDRTKNSLKNVEKLLDILDSIVRNRSNVRVFALANNVSPINPYAEYFKNNKQFKLTYVANNKFVEERLKTPFGQLINDTNYGRFSLYNEQLQRSAFRKANKNTKLVQDMYCFSVEDDNIIYNFWLVGNGSLLVEHEKQPPVNAQLFSLESFQYAPIRSMNSVGIEQCRFAINHMLYCYLDESNIPFMQKFATFIH